MQREPAGRHAPYYLGIFWYAHRRYDEAIACWERARKLDASFPTVHRNLGLAYFNKRHDPASGAGSVRGGLRARPGRCAVFFELDQLYKRLNHAPAERLARLEQHADLVEQRDDLTIERITLLNLLDRPDEAYALLMGRNFHPWEGGEGKVTGQYVASLVAKAKAHLRRGRGRSGDPVPGGGAGLSAQPGRRQAVRRAGEPHLLLPGPGHTAPWGTMRRAQRHSSAQRPG